MEDTIAGGCRGGIISTSSRQLTFCLSVAGLDKEIETLTSEIDAVFSTPAMKQAGPFELNSFLVRNGLNGRGTSWAVVRDDDGKWWRIKDLSKEEVS